MLASWAADLVPSASDVELATRSLQDTVAAIVAARDHPAVRTISSLGEGARWTVAGHVLDFDDLHLASTTHVSVVCVPAALATGGGERAYLAAAGVMTKLGTALGWKHYAAGWHATCTAGAPAAAVGAAVAWGLDPQQIASAMALAVPGAGGIQAVFGSDGKSLQVGMAVDSGLRAARLAAAGARGDPRSLDAWIRLVGGDPEKIDTGGPTVTGGLATKLYPCCYALQRPIEMLTTLANAVDSRHIRRIVLRTLESTVAPLIHHRPTTGLQAKFSAEYAAAAALLDRHPGLDSFSDAAVARDEAQRLMAVVELDLEPGGTGLLDGYVVAEVHTDEGAVLSATGRSPAGAPDRPATAAQIRTKQESCLRGLEVELGEWTWANTPTVLRQVL